MKSQMVYLTCVSHISITKQELQISFRLVKCVISSNIFSTVLLYYCFFFHNAEKNSVVRHARKKSNGRAKFVAVLEKDNGRKREGRGGGGGVMPN